MSESNRFELILQEKFPGVRNKATNAIIIKDTQTGVQYLGVTTGDINGIGLTVLRDQDGKLVVD